MNDYCLPFDDLIMQLWTLLCRSSYSIRRAREQELHKMGLTWIQAAVLHEMQNVEEPLTITQLARRLFREPHTISQLIVRMEKQGLLKKARDLKRKNVVRVLLTNKGEMLRAKSSDSSLIREILSILPENEQKQLLIQLSKIYNEAINSIAMASTNDLPTIDIDSQLYSVQGDCI